VSRRGLRVVSLRWPHRRTHRASAGTTQDCGIASPDGRRQLLARAQLSQPRMLTLQTCWLHLRFGLSYCRDGRRFQRDRLPEASGTERDSFGRVESGCCVSVTRSTVGRSGQDVAAAKVDAGGGEGTVRLFGGCGSRDGDARLEFLRLAVPVFHGEDRAVDAADGLADPAVADAVLASYGFCTADGRSGARSTVRPISFSLASDSTAL
jgi:hypothetical protein